MKTAQAMVSLRIEWQCPYCQNWNSKDKLTENTSRCTWCGRTVILALGEMSYEQLKRNEVKKQG